MNAISGTRDARLPWRLGARTILTGLLLTLAALPAAADTAVRARVSGTTDFGADSGQGFNLHLGRRDLAVDYADDSPGDRLEVSRIGISWFETVAPNVRMGFSIGRQGIDQTGRANTAGLDPVGYYASFDTMADWAVGERLRLELGGRIEYAEADDGGNPDGVEIDWWSARLEPGASVLLNDRVELRAGARLQWLDGDERRTGSAPATVSFAEDGIAGGFVGLGLHTGNGGRIRLRADAGPVRGVWLVFERRY